MKSTYFIFPTCWLSAVLMLAAWTASLSNLEASGSYLFRPPQPPAGAVEDSQKYELGKAIFAGKTVLSEPLSAQTQPQFVRLAYLQEKLPPRVKKTADLTSLAGKLSREQMAALEYFLKLRHKVA